MPTPAIFGLEGLALGAGERAFFAALDPLGFILFSRNCRDPRQVRALTDELRALTGRADTPILIDQEGGRVARLGPPHWRHPPPAARFGALWDRDAAKAEEAARLNGLLIGAELAACGITVDCAPVLDVPAPGSHGIVGDRAWHATPEGVTALGRAFADGLMAAGILPVAKHIPGHGRARADSHAELPVVDAARQDLAASDFAPFAALAGLPLAMTAHILYTALDRERQATISPVVIVETIRREIGFAGLLMSDDISANMKALPGSYGARAQAALAAGCDVVLHCNGAMAEMREVAAVLPALSGDAAARWGRASASATRPAEPVNIVAAGAALARLLT